jgi:hypothetical protein
LRDKNNHNQTHNETMKALHSNTVITTHNKTKINTNVLESHDTEAGRAVFAACGAVR